MAKSKVTVDQVQVPEEALSTAPLHSACVQWDAYDSNTGEAVTVIYDILAQKATYLSGDGSKYCGNPDYLTSQIIDPDPDDSCAPTYEELYAESYPDFFLFQ